MVKVAVAVETTVGSARSWRDYLELTKPNVVLLLVFTAVVGMALSTPGMVPWLPALTGTVGIGLASASAAALNHLIDQQADARMARTRHRPIPQGALSSREVLLFALGIGALGMAILVVFNNVLTAWLTFLSLIGYAVVYTLYLKRASPQNIVIGGLAGAMPPVLGWAAVTGEVTAEPLLLALIVFVWTPPHFWALAIHRRNDYAKVEIPMLPVTHGTAYTRLHVLLYAILLIPVTLSPFLIGMSHVPYLLGTLVLDVWFLWHCVLLYRNPDDTRQPMITFWVSIKYLMGLFAVLLVDHYLPVLERTLA
ncbi:MAG: heme o synthase [Pseudomonadota bacterium]